MSKFAKVEKHFTHGDHVSGLTKKDQKIIGIFTQLAEAPYAYVKGRMATNGSINIFTPLETYKVLRSSLTLTNPEPSDSVAK